MNLLDANDQVGQYPSSWYAATANTTLQLGTMDGDKRCEVCVIGAGYSGLSAAYHLAKSGKKVVLIDAHRVGWGASGRNGGQLGSGQRLEQFDLEKLVGRAQAKGLWQLAEDSKELVKNLIRNNNIDCAIKPGILHANHRARFNKHSKDEATLLRDEYGYSAIRYIEREECHEMVGSPIYHGGTIDTDSAHLHPLNYALGLAKAAINAGAQIFETTRALSIDHGQQVVVNTDKGKITADNLVLACNGYLGELDATVNRRVMPINNFIIATEPLSEAMAKSVIRDDIAVADSKFVVNYFRLSEDRRMLFGGRESYGYTFPSDIKSFVAKPMLELFPQLRDAKIDYGWGGTLAITMNRLPHFAHISDNVKSISGYSGHGLGMATLAGKLVAETINGNAESFDQFQSINAKKFPGGPALRSPLLVLAMLYHSMLDKF